MPAAVCISWLEKYVFCTRAAMSSSAPIEKDTPYGRAVFTPEGAPALTTLETVSIAVVEKSRYPAARAADLHVDPRWLQAKTTWQHRMKFLESHAAELAKQSCTGSLPNS